ncbi:MAG: GGDEF domain-containing protein [Planctomycetota bacterium]
MRTDVVMGQDSREAAKPAAAAEAEEIRLAERGESWRFRIFRIVLIASILGLGIWSVRLTARGYPLLGVLHEQEVELESLESLSRSLHRVLVSNEVEEKLAFLPPSQTLDAWIVAHESKLEDLGIAVADVLPAADDPRPDREEARLLITVLGEAQGERRMLVHALQSEIDGAWSGLTVLVVILFLQALAALVLLDLNVRARRRIAVLFRRATRDELTAVLNRRAILEVAERELDRARREGSDLAVLIVDLDHFKTINDDFGHRAGDVFLIEAAERFRSSLRPYDSVGRYGGDEFMLVLPGCDAESVDAICRRVCEAMREPVDLDGRSWVGSVSIGAAVAVRGADSLPALIESADRALYRTKEQGRDGWTALTHLPNVGVPAEAREDVIPSETGSSVG